MACGLSGPQRLWLERRPNGVESPREVLRRTSEKDESSSPPVVPGAAPALAKAGVGGYIYTVYTVYT